MSELEHLRHTSGFTGERAEPPIRTPPAASRRASLCFLRLSFDERVEMENKCRVVMILAA